ncbi:eukaryotic translation initiation factor 4e,putative [Trypanosoma brucei gambiense DAL972]|uniref:Eukaryotic translation initiation factor 4e,putative n=1 Tax=Trypanosoma brucei gambiense (strain MHOM/CI/86/DAL972) TaxID=679716 RepID=D0A633_TRYB9|nr:eukaryotic translation initiation factor 4e,putative [Trypanosoma brucei gambiense DAL972]CBH17134.1 eukaryotic translation initiation factor 4e,putative [Trypanosoma brucei gambiense DAL972]|eukprot:XP_011779398.1 eukaryotic translation initiation factor 4e,putative [Trypanosoma brucei gambiense DAL972]
MMAESSAKEMEAIQVSAAGDQTAKADDRYVIIDRGVKRHLLNRPWTLWYDSVSTYDCKQWELSLIEVMTVRTVEDFFAMLHYCKPPHVLRVSAQYHFFREGVKPMWEDPNNKAGGKLWVSLDDKTMTDKSGAAGGGKTRKDNGTDADKKPELDTVWENVLIALVGEYLDYGVEGEHIMGVVLTKRKYCNRIALWLKDASDSDAVAAIEKQLVKEAGLLPTTKPIFTAHGASKA